MHALDDGVGFQQLPVPVARTADDRAIIARSDPDIRAEREGAGEFRDDAIFAEVGEFHSGGTTPLALSQTTQRLVKLKSACMPMGTSSEPVRS